jgi:hypothetical protein
LMLVADEVGNRQAAAALKVLVRNNGYRWPVFEQTCAIS